jgi:hypothetical protein
MAGRCRRAPASTDRFCQAVANAGRPALSLLPLHLFLFLRTPSEQEGDAPPIASYGAGSLGRPQR